MALSRSLLHRLNQLHDCEVIITDHPNWHKNKPLTGRVIGWSFESGVDDEPLVEVCLSSDLPNGWADQLENTPLSQIQIATEPFLFPSGWSSPKLWFNQRVLFQNELGEWYQGDIVGLEYRETSSEWQYSILVDPTNPYSRIEPICIIEEHRVTPLTPGLVAVGVELGELTPGISPEKDFFHKPQIAEKLAASIAATSARGRG